MSLYHQESNNDRAFKNARKFYLNRYKFCRICDVWVPRNDRSVDHIIPMWRYEGEYWEQRNWQMLCPICHDIKTSVEGQP